MAVSLVRTYRFQNSGNFSVDCSGGVTAILILAAPLGINSASLSGINFTVTQSGHVAFASVSVSGTLALSLNAGGYVYCLCFAGANYVHSSAYYSENIPPLSYDSGTTLTPTKPGGYMAIMNCYSSAYISNETTGWTEDYSLYGPDGVVIHNMRRKVSASTSEFYQARNNNGTNYAWFYRVMAEVDFKGGVTFIGVY